MTATAHLVTVGAMPAAGADGAAVADTLAAEGITLASRVFIEDEEAGLERGLGRRQRASRPRAGDGDPARAQRARSRCASGALPACRSAATPAGGALGPSSAGRDGVGCRRRRIRMGAGDRLARIRGA